MTQNLLLAARFLGTDVEIDMRQRENDLFQLTLNLFPLNTALNLIANSELISLPAPLKLPNLPLMHEKR